MISNWRKSSSGQVVVEYILMITVIVSVIMGVFWSVLERQVDDMKANLEDKLTAVISQSQIGIPLGWFGLDRPATEVVRFEPGGTGDPAASDNPADENADEKDKDKNKDPDGGNSPLSPPSASPPSSGRRGKPSPPSPPESTPPSSTKGSGGAPDGEEATRNAQRAKGDSDDGGPKVNDKGEEEEFAGGVSSDRKPPKEGSGKEGAAEGKKKAGGGDAVANQGQRFLFGRGAEAEGGDCEDIDLFTLLKLGALVAVILLIFAVMVTAKGQKGD